MKTIKERASLAAWQIFEEIGLSQHSVERVSEIIEEKILEQKAIDNTLIKKLFEKAWSLAYSMYQAGRDNLIPLTKEEFRKAMEE